MEILASTSVVSQVETQNPRESGGASRRYFILGFVFVLTLMTIAISEDNQPNNQIIADAGVANSLPKGNPKASR